MSDSPGKGSSFTWSLLSHVQGVRSWAENIWNHASDSVKQDVTEIIDNHRQKSKSEAQSFLLLLACLLGFIVLSSMIEIALRVTSFSFPMIVTLISVGPPCGWLTFQWIVRSKANSVRTILFAIWASNILTQAVIPLFGLTRPLYLGISNSPLSNAQLTGLVGNGVGRLLALLLCSFFWRSHRASLASLSQNFDSKSRRLALIVISLLQLLLFDFGLIAGGENPMTTTTDMIIRIISIVRALAVFWLFIHLQENIKDKSVDLVANAVLYYASLEGPVLMSWSSVSSSAQAFDVLFQSIPGTEMAEFLAVTMRYRLMQMAMCTFALIQWLRPFYVTTAHHGLSRDGFLPLEPFDGTSHQQDMTLLISMGSVIASVIAIAILEMDRRCFVSEQSALQGKDAISGKASYRLFLMTQQPRALTSNLDTLKTTARAVSTVITIFRLAGPILNFLVSDRPRNAETTMQDNGPTD